MKQALLTKAAPAPIGQYSQAIRVNETVYISGQIGLSPVTGELIPGGVRQEVAQLFENIEKIAIAAGGSLDHLVALTVYLANLHDIEIVNDLINQKIKQPWPARAAVQVVKLPRGAAVEISAIMIC